MRLLRIGGPGADLPCGQEPEGTVLDASVVAEDYTPDFFATGELERLREALDRHA